MLRRSETMAINKGDVYIVSLDPTVGEEVKKTRPAVIVSSNLVNAIGGLVIVVPLTGSTGKTSTIHVPIPMTEGGVTRESVANCSQIRAVSKDRLVEKSGALSASTMKAVDEGILWVLGLR